MSTLMGDREQEKPRVALPVRDEDLPRLLKCTRCNLSYMPGKSSSALRLTYCSFLCELGDLGFSIAGLEHMVLKKVEPAAELAPEPVLTEPVATA
ncbi:MAG: hypothetical protein ACKVT1_06615 [Dehalococcoidia bacterium]